MYNKPFALEITATSPFGYKIDGEQIIGIVITGDFHTDDEKFLNDLIIDDEKREGLKQILGGKLPIEKEVNIQFNERPGMIMKFPSCGQLSCELEEVKVHPSKVDGKIKGSIKIKVPTIKEDSAGKIVSHLKDEVKIELTLNQNDLFENKEQKTNPKKSTK